MVSRCGAARCLALAACASFLFGCYLASIPLHKEQVDAPKQSADKHVQVDLPRISHPPGRHRLAVIVPFRDRFEELLDFIPHMYDFLNKQGIPFHIFIMQQRDGLRFNRASLINAGFLFTKQDYDYIAMHDVDLLPLNDKLRYDYPESNPFHISAPELHPKYHYATFIGGILLIKREHFELVNGMSNRYWGWGLEDDEFYVRLKDAGLTVQRPVNITSGTDNTFKHVHDKSHRRRDTRKCYNQREVTRRRDRVTGLHDLSYTVATIHHITVEGLAATVIDIKLQCNQTATPWCLCPEPQVKNKSVPKN